MLLPVASPLHPTRPMSVTALLKGAPSQVFHQLAGEFGTGQRNDTWQLSLVQHAGMQEVRGSNPLSSTQVREINSKS